MYGFLNHTLISNTIYQIFPFQTLRRTVENIKDPLYRFFEREVAAGASLLQQVLHDLHNVTAICQVRNLLIRLTEKSTLNIIY